MSEKQIVLITGASSGFGALTARAVADNGDAVYAGMRHTDGRNAPQVQAAADYAMEHGVDLRAIELDVNSQESVDAAVARVLAEHGRIDVLIHNAGHMVVGPAEAFTPEQLAELYDINVLSTQRVNRAVLPGMRVRGAGLVVWVSSSSVKGGTPPYLAPYFAAKAGMDSLAVSYAAELARWGVETSIVVPGSFTRGTNHFAHSGKPADAEVEAAYETRYAGLMDQVAQKLAALAPADADASLVSDEIARIVALPPGQRPYRVHVDPADDGSQEVSEVADRVRREFLARVDLSDLLTVERPRSHPRAIEHFVEATNAGDTEAFVSAFAPDARLDDWGRVFTGHDGIRAWNRTDNIGVQAHFDLLDVRAESAPGTYVATLRVSGNGYNGTGPMRFRLRDGVIAELRIG